MVTVGASTEVNQSPWFNTADGPLMLEAVHVAMEDTFVYDVVAEAAHPDNGRPFLQLRIHKGNTGLGVALQMTADQGTVHAWNHTHLSNDVGNWGQDFQAATSGWLQGTPAYGIQQPACGESVIAIKSSPVGLSGRVGCPTQDTQFKAANTAWWAFTLPWPHSTSPSAGRAPVA